MPGESVVDAFLRPRRSAVYGACMRRIPGTHVHSNVKCPHQAALALHETRPARRAAPPLNGFAAGRGRDVEGIYAAVLNAPVTEDAGAGEAQS